jgi:hypothetical protein
MKKLLEQEDDFEASKTISGEQGVGIKHEVLSKKPRWEGLMKANSGGRCFYCGQQGHFISRCEEAKADVAASLVELHSERKFWLDKRNYILNMSNETIIKERVQWYYNEKKKLHVTRNKKTECVLYKDTSNSILNHFYVAEDPTHNTELLVIKDDVGEWIGELDDVRQD